MHGFNWLSIETNSCKCFGLLKRKSKNYAQNNTALKHTSA